MCVDEAMTVEELGHDVGPEGHVEGRACLLALEQVRVVAHLHKSRYTRSVFLLVLTRAYHVMLKVLPV